MFPLADRQFALVKTGLLRAALPVELSASVHNRKPHYSIVVTLNKRQLARVDAAKFVPTGVIAAGAMRRRLLLEAGIVKSWAFVEAGVDITADDKIGSSELMNRLENLILEKMYGATKQPITGQPWPYIIEVYPFENYFIWSMKGQKYRQMYALDPVERKVKLVGESQKVQEKYVDAGIQIRSAEAKETLPMAQTGARYAWGWTKGNTQSATQGARNSELVTEIIRNCSDVDKAAAAYVQYAKSAGQTMREPMPHSFYPVTISKDGKVAVSVRAALVKAGIEPFQFAKWLAGVEKGTFRLPAK